MRIKVKAWVIVLAVALLAADQRPARADQGGVGFWLPGAFGSLAATPLVPGWSMGAVYIHSDVSAGGDVSASRAIHFPNRTANLTVNLNAQLGARVDIGMLSPGYT